MLFWKNNFRIVFKRLIKYKFSANNLNYLRMCTFSCDVCYFFWIIKTVFQYCYFNKFMSIPARWGLEQAKKRPSFYGEPVT